MQTLSKQRREELRTILLFLIPLMLLFLLMLVAGVYMFALDVRTKSLFELLTSAHRSRTSACEPGVSEKRL